MKTVLIVAVSLLAGAVIAGGSVLGVTRPWEGAEQVTGAPRTPTASPTAKAAPVAPIPSAIPPTTTPASAGVLPTQEPSALPPPPEPSLPPAPPPPTEAPPPPPPPVEAPPPAPSVVDRWNTCEITWAQGMEVEQGLALARISGSSTEYLSRQYDSLRSYLEANCRGIGSILSQEPGAASACWKMLQKGAVLEQAKDMSRISGTTTYFVDFGLAEVDAFVRAVGC